MKVKNKTQKDLELKVIIILKYITEYVNKEKLIKRCFKCNTFGHLSNSCENNDSLCLRCGSNKQKCKGNCPKQHWKCVNY